jgi:broad specificity phosphatase PhoE
VRNAEAQANLERRFIRSTPLTSHGRLQAAALASELLPVPLSAVFRSPLQQALETAQIIASCGCPLTIVDYCRVQWELPGAVARKDQRHALSFLLNPAS